MTTQEKVDLLNAIMPHVQGIAKISPELAGKLLPVIMEYFKKTKETPGHNLPALDSQIL